MAKRNKKRHRRQHGHPAKAAARREEHRPSGAPRVRRDANAVELMGAGLDNMSPTQRRAALLKTPVPNTSLHELTWGLEEIKLSTHQFVQLLEKTGLPDATEQMSLLERDGSTEILRAFTDRKLGERFVVVTFISTRTDPMPGVHTGFGVILRRHFAGLVAEPLRPGERWRSMLTADTNKTLQHAREIEAIEPETVPVTSGLTIPKWELNYSYDHVWRELERCATGYLQYGTQNAQTYNSLTLLAQLQRAHVVSVDPVQVNVLPDWETIQEAKDYASSVHLPFSPLYIDTDGPGNLGSTIYSDMKLGDTRMLRGALVWDSGEGLCITPFGGYGDDADPYEPPGIVRFGVPSPPDGTSVIKRDFFGQGEVEMLRYGIAHSLQAAMLAYQPTVSNEGDHIPETGVVDLFMPVDWVEREGINESAMVAAGYIAYVHALRVLSILFLLETPNVELVEATDRAARRRVEHSNARISSVVYVRSNTKRYITNGTSDEANYSHRFEVRGHYKHLPVGTRAADARPDLLRDCPRCGKCRRIWCPPFIKGDENLPFVPKTRVLREEG